MSQLSLPEDIADNLERLHKCYFYLQTLNEDLQSRPFSTKIQNQFDGQVKQSQYLISKLTNSFQICIKEYKHQGKNDKSSHLSSVPETSQTTTATTTTATTTPVAPFNSAMILGFKSLCIRVEREWRIGAKYIKEQLDREKESKEKELEDIKLQRIQNKPKNKPPPPPVSAARRRGGGGANKSKKNKNRRKFATISDSSGDDNNDSGGEINFDLNTNTDENTDDKINRTKKLEYLNSHATHDKKLEPVVSDDWNAKIDSLLHDIEMKNNENDNINNNNNNNTNNNNENRNSQLQTTQFVEDTEYMKELNLLALPPSNMENELNESILEINEKLQQLVEITSDLDDLIQDQQTGIDAIEKNVEDANDQVLDAASRLASIRKSKVTYAVIGLFFAS